ncbi:hypothetical protein KAI46_00915 [bacterium]|nr:hypothetical protein [bacterium]
MDWKNNSYLHLLILGVVATILATGAYYKYQQKELPEQPQLPPHRVVDNSSLYPGRNGYRIEIHCDNMKLTREEARQLIEHYRSQAGIEGQIGIHKLDRELHFYPWAVLNVGEPIKFQDSFFQ